MGPAYLGPIEAGDCRYEFGHCTAVERVMERPLASHCNLSCMAQFRVEPWRKFQRHVLRTCTSGPN